MKPYSVSALDRRTSTEQIDLASEMGDSVLRRRDGLPAYQIASLIDDLDSGCNLIVRGDMGDWVEMELQVADDGLARFRLGRPLGNVHRDAIFSVVR